MLTAAQLEQADQGARAEISGGEVVESGILAEEHRVFEDITAVHIYSAFP